jgi:hypothetical protein
VEKSEMVDALNDEMITRFNIGDVVHLSGSDASMVVGDIEVIYEIVGADNPGETATVRLADGYKVLGPIVRSRCLCLWTDTYRVLHKEWIQTVCLDPVVG